MAGLLTKITKGRQSKPLRVGVTGPPGIGKSTFALGAPNALYIDADRRTDHLDVLGRLVPGSWKDITDTMRELSATTPAASGFGTVVFDTLDAMEQLLWAHVCKLGGKSQIEDFGFGKGYSKAETGWNVFYDELEALRSAGYITILIAHSELKRFSNPVGEDYEYWGVKLHKKAADMFTSRVDCLGFAAWDDVATEPKGTSKAKVLTSGKRSLKFAHNPAYQTKRGFDLPDETDLTWEDFHSKVYPE